MASRFKGSIDFKRESWEAAMGRVRDEKHPWRIPSEELAAARAFQEFNGEGLSTPPLLGGQPASSINEQFYLKDLKYLIHFSNLKANKLGEWINQFTKDSFASVLEAQRETIALLSEVTEEETKLLSNYTKVHYNAFVRNIDAPLQWANQTALKDFKTGFAFNQRYLMSVLHDAGLVLPIRADTEVPILDAYIIDELSDVGDSYFPLEISDPKNLIRSNKTFKYVIIRKEHDLTSRKYKTKTSYDNYPHSCESILTIELELPATTMINYLRLEPIGDSSVTIPPDGLSYKAEDGADISLTTISIPTETATTLLFQPIYTKYLRISLLQTGTIGRRDIIAGDKQIKLFNELLSEAAMSTRLPNTTTAISGRVYDFSLSNVKVGLLAFDNRGIFRSANAVNIDSPIGFDIVKSVEQIIPIESFDSYLQSVTSPEGRVLYETYAYLRLYGGSEAFEFIPGVTLQGANKKLSDALKNTLSLDALAPLPDTYPLQYEYLEPVVNIARLKLFPDMLWNSDQKMVDSICIDTLLLDPNESTQILYDVFALDLGSEDREQLKSNLEALTGGTLYAATNLSLNNYLYDMDNNVHLEARADISAIIKSLTTIVSGGGTDRDTEIIFTAPSDADIQDILGSAWLSATDEEKDEVRAFPENYLLTSKGAISGRSSSLRYNETATVSFYVRTGILPDSYENRDYFLGDALHNTKLLKLTIQDIDTSSGAAIITVSMELVRGELTEGLGDYTRKEKDLLNNISGIRELSLKYRNLFLQSSPPEPKSRAVFSIFKELLSKVLGGSVVIQRIKTPNNDITWEQMLGSRGSSLFKPVKFAYSIGRGTGTFPYSRSETLASLAICDDWVLNTDEGLWDAQRSYLPSPLEDPKINFTLDGSEIFPYVQMNAWKITTTENHGLHIGDIIAFQTVPSTVADGEYRVIAVGSKSFYIKYLDDKNKQAMKGISLSELESVCLASGSLSKVHDSGFRLSPIEVYENDVLLKISVDYEISLNDGSDWLEFWPVDSSYSSYMDAAKAGRFYIRLKAKRRGAIYWVKYRVKGNQELIDNKKVYLRNGRVTCHESLRGLSGTLMVVIVARTRSSNPYLTPLMRNYSLRVQEQPNVKRDSGRLLREQLKKTRRGSSLSVS